MERQPMKSTRRKACDFCYHKKIKCDSVKPQCSPCKLYNADCTYVAKTRQHVTKHTSTSTRIDLLEERLRSVEQQLRSINGRTSAEGSQPPPHYPSLEPELGSPDDTGTAAPTGGSHPLGVLDRLGVPPCCGCVPVHECISSTESFSPDRLPPLDEVRPLIEKFFTSGNMVFPLFHAPSFFRLLNSFYSVPASRTNVAWAIINTVIAMSQRPFGNYQAAKPYIRNAQSVLDQIVVCGSNDMAALQVTLGLAGLIYGSPDVISYCGVLVSIAIRLVQRLRLYSKHQPSELVIPESEALERNRLFWFTYILDRDLSAKTRQPPLLRDEDIDVDLPALDPEDGGGVIVSVDGSARFNLFRSRIQIAWVQGKAYDWLCSTRASKATTAQREQVIHKLERVLFDWKCGVPRPFLPENVVSETEPDVTRHFIALHWEHFFCQAMIRGAHIHNQPWLLRLAGGNSEIVSSYFNEIKQAKFTPDSRERSQEVGWDNLVQNTRTCMKLVDSSDPADAHLLWCITSGYFSGACVLLAHLLENPLGPTAKEDQRLIDTSSEKLNKIVGEIRLKKVIYFQKAFNEIHGRVKNAIDSAPLSAAQGIRGGEQRVLSIWPEMSDFEFTYVDVDAIESMELSWATLPGS